jgi:hypothetical protein
MYLSLTEAACMLRLMEFSRASVAAQEPGPSAPPRSSKPLPDDAASVSLSDCSDAVFDEAIDVAFDRLEFSWREAVDREPSTPERAVELAGGSARPRALFERIERLILPGAGRAVA